MSRLEDDATIPAPCPCGTTMPRRPRNPLIGIVLIVVVSALGIGSRRYAAVLPGFVAAYAGDTLWALAAFLGFGVLLPRASTRKVALLAMAFSVAVELSQLYHAPWIDAIRGTTVGGLILGFGFLWSDLACYALGVGIGVLIEVVMGASRALTSRVVLLARPHSGPGSDCSRGRIADQSCSLTWTATGFSSRSGDWPRASARARTPMVSSPSV